MNSGSIELIRSRLKTYFELLGTSDDTNLFHFGREGAKNDSVSIICHEENLWKLIHMERGSEKVAFESQDMEELLYEIVTQRAWAKAYNICGQKAANKTEDKRRCWHREQFKLLSSVNEEWLERFQKQVEYELNQKPYDDDADKRRALMRELKSSGFTHEQAKQASYEKYPKPMPKN